MNRIEKIINNKDLKTQITNTRLLSFLAIITQKRAEISSIIDNVKKSELYASPIHGEYHSEKVFLFAYIIAETQGLTPAEKEILFDACLYHDIGRSADDADSLHGFISANKIEEVIGNKPLYQNPNNIKLLKAIMDIHAQDDEKNRRVFDYYELPEEYYPIYCQLFKILKDADALDRKRFVERSIAYLNPNYLRIPISKELIAFSELINKMYNEFMRENYKEIDESNTAESSCYHGIGFDFFKIKSILENGILSEQEMHKQKKKPIRNFDGGNTYRWVSVVDASISGVNATGYKEFIDFGINFLCEGVKLHNSLPLSKKDEAFFYGLPYNRGKYDDEKYAFEKIDPSKIKKLSLSQKHTTVPIKNLNYLLNSISYDYIKDKLLYYLNKTGGSLTEKEQEIVSQSLEKHRLLERKFMTTATNNRDKAFDDMIVVIRLLASEINTIIGNLIERYYIIVTHNENPTIKDVIEYELSQVENVIFSVVETDAGLQYNLNSFEKKV